MSSLRFNSRFACTARQLASICCKPLYQPERIDDFAFKNEPIFGYCKESKERNELKDAIDRTSECIEEIPIVIGDREYMCGESHYQVMPHRHKHRIAKFYHAPAELIDRAIQTANDAQKKWDETPLQERIRIWQRAANLMAGKYRQQLNAATILGQAKTMIQAEIDAAVELVDFFNVNCFFYKEAAKYQPHSPKQNTTRNSVRYRGFDGFVAAITPFNFTAIAGNLAYTPALIGNTVLWKPSDTAILSNWLIFKICREAGVPPGVVNFVPAAGPTFGNLITSSSCLAGINFTGSTKTFQVLWQQVGQNIAAYRNFPRLVGEVGGKNYHLVHPTADLNTACACTIRSAFEFSGQKCSAVSRLYVADSMWTSFKNELCDLQSRLKVDDPTQFDTFTSAVIDHKAYERCVNVIKAARQSDNLKVIAGGGYDGKCGYFVEPTIIETRDPKDPIMQEEIFGPILAVYVYDDCNIDGVMKLIEETTQFALTGSVFAEDETFLKIAEERLRMTAGNFYINDKSTGSVVGQQPFGGSRKSGTNDKAGGPFYILRWGNPQTITETLEPTKDLLYPYMTKK